VQPKTHGFAVDVDHLAHISAEKTEVFDVLVYIALFLHDSVAVLLCEDVLDFSGGVDQAHH
jgi:hypothetical protein